ncbi:ankyrin repeat domain-containing protein 7-like [Ptychodera flava]|uniref:ankyrin repeat domain-containing protein 7-like n=1 Tax=Ptychodera flava TaxID=63121 RepID=UPI00396A41E9
MGTDRRPSLLLNPYANSEIPEPLNKEDSRSRPSLPHLAITRDCLDYATFLVEQGYGFRPHEQDILMQRVLTAQIKVKKRVDVLKFLLDNGADLNHRYAGGNTPLHYSAGMTGPTDILETLLSYGADVDALNDDQCTPLFFAMQGNNMYSASLLIDNGSNLGHKNIQGLTAFDFILNFDEWIECPYFSDEIKARLKEMGNATSKAIPRRLVVDDDPSLPIHRKVAIVGIGCRYANGIDDAQKFWKMLVDGMDCTSSPPG